MKLIPKMIGFLLGIVGVNAQRVNFSNITNQNTTSGLLTQINQATDQALGIGTIIGTFSVAFTGLKIFGVKQAFTPATAVTFMMALLFWALSWIPDWVFIISGVMLALGVVALIIDKDN